LYKGNEYFVSFSDFNGTVAGYKGIDVRSNDKGGSIITLGMQGEIRQEWLSTLIRRNAYQETVGQ
jgi:hypothetical protein